MIWGVGLGEDDPAVQNPALRKRLNLLGFALMEVRNRLRGCGVPNFRLNLMPATQEAHAVNGEIVIRMLAKDDYPSWKSLWDGYNAFYGRHGATELPPETTQMTWSRF